MEEFVEAVENQDWNFVNQFLEDAKVPIWKELESEEQAKIKSLCNSYHSSSSYYDPQPFLDLTYYLYDLADKHKK